MDFQENGKIPIGIIEFNEAKKLIEAMAEKGVELEARHNDQTCRTKCKPSVEVWVKLEDIPAIQQYMHEKNLSILEAEGIDIDHERLNSVYDPESKIAVCPACGTEFNTDQKECPECGLVFIPEE
jgi:rRNA maturation endonuclease Nob1